MPNKPAAKKGLRQAKKNAIRNVARREAFRSAIKNAVKAADPSAQGGKNIIDLVRAAQKALDKAAKHGTIKKNTAARKLSRLMKRVAGKK